MATIDVGVAGAAWGRGWIQPVTAVGLFCLGAAMVLFAVFQQAHFERLAASLCGDGRSQSLARSLAHLAYKLEEVRHRIGRTHPVTGVPTRELLCEEIAADIANDPQPRLLGAIRFVDFDRLAAFDHAAATSALRRLAGRLQTAAQSAHVIGQVDRDCFGVWFRGTGSIEAAAAEFRGIVHVTAQEIAESDITLNPTIETALVRYPHDGPDASHLLLRAAAALSRASLVRSSASPEAANLPDAKEQFELEQDLIRAIAEEQLAMVFQPVVDIRAGRVLGAEALLRWDHPKLGSVSPARFFPVIEALGMSERYGLWVLNAACREARMWKEAGLTGLKVAVNVSARQLLDQSLKTKIERTLDRHRLQPADLELELTETAAMADASRTLHLFSELRDLGISLAIDDFGSGYSSLSYLKNLPFDKLKIDREFVTNIDTRGDSRAICKALIELGRGLELLVLAEGVETAGEVGTLYDLGCTVFQGYHFSKPISGAAFRQLVVDRAWLSSLKPPTPAPFELQGSTEGEGRKPARARSALSPTKP